MTEYILLVALIAIVAIVAVKKFGRETKESFDKATTTVSGEVNAADEEAHKKP